MYEKKIYFTGEFIPQNFGVRFTYLYSTSTISSYDVNIKISSESIYIWR